MGSSANLFAAVLPLQSWTCFGLLVVSANSTTGSSSKCYNIHYSDPPGSVVLTAILPAVFVLQAGERYSHYTKRGHAGIRHQVRASSIKPTGSRCWYTIHKQLHRAGRGICGHIYTNRDSQERIPDEPKPKLRQTCRSGQYHQNIPTDLLPRSIIHRSQLRLP